MKKNKFRIWDKENNCFWENIYEAYKGNVQELLINLNGDLILRTLEGTTHESVFPDRFEILRYIGLDDVNGKEIYENYIVKFGRFAGNPVTGTYWVEDIGVIRWINNHSSFRFCYNGQEQKIRDCYYWEVIGNIYENKELLIRK